MPAPSQQPQIILIGGPNGAGKTTFVRSFLREISCRYLSADQIAYDLCPEDVASVAVQAGRQFLLQIRKARENRESVIVESTLSGKGLARELRAFRAAGYEIRLVFISLPSVRTSSARVALRVSKGGHDVPAQDIRRRFYRTHVNFWELYRPIAHRWELFYNGHQLGHQLVARGKDRHTSVLKPIFWNTFWTILDAD
ncbi:MAG: zeta toxin family protein [Verrucomicrobiae bacterium]|nr:zeta toxin family protein [Verrucomicrobiae bacterium]